MHLPFTLSIMYWSQQLSFLYTKMEVRFPFVHETLDPIQTIRVLYQRSGSFLNYSTRNSLPRSSKLRFCFFFRRGRLDSSKISQWLFWSNCSNRIEYWIFLIYHCNILQLHISHFYKYIYIYIYLLLTLFIVLKCWLTQPLTIYGFK